MAEHMYSLSEIESLSYKLRSALEYLFISSGIFTSLFINSACLPNEYSGAVRLLVLDVLVCKNSEGKIIKPILNGSDFIEGGRLKNYYVSHYKSLWADMVQKEGRMKCIVFRDGTVQLLPSAQISNIKPFDNCKESDDIVRIISEHFKPVSEVRQ